VKIIPPELLEQVVQRLKPEFQPEAIFLFGSHAWGTPHDDSGMDLMVIVRESGERAIRRMQRAHRCLRGLRLSKDVFVQTRQEFDTAFEQAQVMYDFVLSLLPPDARP
jgi:predicted nucleotidyltransferase